MYELPIINKSATKAQLKNVADISLNEILERGNIIEVADMISKIEFFFKELKSKKEYTDYLRNEIEKFGKVHTTSSGTKIQLAEVGTKYDYSKCRDTTLTQMELDLTALENRISERKEFLKTIPYGGMQVLMGDEIVVLNPPMKTSKSSVVITLKA